MEKNTDDISDGYHTFWELYKHRHHLFIALCRSLDNNAQHQHTNMSYKSKLHNDWSELEWWFILQLESYEWQISYHLPNEYWDKCDFSQTQERAIHKFDWHTSDDVLERLLKI